MSRSTSPVFPALTLGAALFAAASMAHAQSVSLDLAGADDDLTDAINTASLTLSLPSTDGAVSQDYVAAARADYRRILTALYSEGHYGAAVSIQIDGREAAGIAPLDAPARINTVSIAVDPGPAYRFGTVGVGPVTSATQLPEAFTTGEIARTGAIRAAVRAAVDGWRDEGHAKAAPTAQDITAVHPDQRVDAAITIAPGPRLSFGALTLRGNEAVRAERVRAIAGYPEGDVYSPAEIEAATARLQRTGTFSSVAFVESETIAAGDTLPFELLVDEREPRRIGAGIEVSSVDGLSVSAFWLHRNLLGGAERFRIEGEASQIGLDAEGIDYRLAVSFARPATFKPDIDLEASATLSQLDEEFYFLRQGTAELSLVQYIRPDLTYRAGVGITAAREETEDRTRDYVLLTLPLEATLDQRNDPLDATAGYFVDLDITPFAGLSGIDSGARVMADARIYRSFGANDRLTLAARAQVGSVFGASLTDAPADFLFYSGGGGTVRGQPYQSLSLTTQADFGNGPVDVETGGASFVGAQLEARYAVTDKIGAVGFYDFGLIGPDALPDSGDPWHAGAGLGLRYDTPIGPVRLDLATPASGDDAGKKVELYIGIGQAF